LKGIEVVRLQIVAVKPQGETGDFAFLRYKCAVVTALTEYNCNSPEAAGFLLFGLYYQTIE